LAEADGFVLRSFARCCGVYLALAALALQLAMSFGHIHRHDIVDPNAAYPNVAYPKVVHSKIDVFAGVQALAKLEVAKQFPSRLADDDGACPICLSTLLLSTSFIPDAPRYSPSSELRDADRVVRHIYDIVFETHRAPFQSRAPPLG
jgi:hypothetical protein